MRQIKRNGRYKVMFVEQVSGDYTTRVSVPYEFLKDIGVSYNEPNVQVKPVENGILITKWRE